MCNEWISVADRLPELKTAGSSAVVLIAKKAKSPTRKKLFVVTGYLVKNYGSLTGEYYTWHDTRSGFDIPIVTHWMPLPEPPKEEE